MSQSLLETLDLSQAHEFQEPTKRIHDGADVNFFLTSTAYKDIMQFILQLNRSMLPSKVSRSEGTEVQLWRLTDDETKFSESVIRVRRLVSSLREIIAEAPPDPGPRRFGNISFRKWHRLVEERLSSLLAPVISPEARVAQSEIETYLLGSFGSPQRLDYGTGHELSFLAFLGCLWKLGHFETTTVGVEERGIVIGVFEGYLELIRTLIKTYNLEPAGTHGVWGLDDNSFLPYVFGSAQLAPAVDEQDDTPTQGSVADAPDPGLVVKANLVDKEKAANMYFSAIAFIHEVKRGPFWEHSPMLFDISGIKDGWGKINKGMLKMYHAEVLSKFPVVQHFPFGSLFRWEKDPEANIPPPTTHTRSQPLRAPVDAHAPATVRPSTMPPSTAAPWATAGMQVPAATPKGFVNGITQAPWASTTRAPPIPRGGFNARTPGRVGNVPPEVVEAQKDEK